ncbi:MAG: DUF3659 domain-containing protein [Cytophagaceae bacterium]|jgi:hypothetical protein|nr:DUF3659 domain-containing protein [Cytophagaceae bacterium]
MKTIVKTILALVVVSLSFSSNAQDYKHPYGFVKKGGEITDSTGKKIGSITSDGTLSDSTGSRIAHVDTRGNLVDAKTGKILGHAPKNGTFVYHFNETQKDTLTISYPSNGTCEVKNSKGDVVLIVHESYKQYGACAYHCLALHKKGQYMKMK